MLLPVLLLTYWLFLTTFPNLTIRCPFSPCLLQTNRKKGPSSEDAQNTPSGERVIRETGVRASAFFSSFFRPTPFPEHNGDAARGTFATPVSRDSAYTTFFVFLFLCARVMCARSLKNNCAFATKARCFSCEAIKNFVFS